MPTIPPSLKPEQVEKLEQALSSGDPEAEAIRRQPELAPYLSGKTR